MWGGVNGKRTRCRSAFLKSNPLHLKRKVAPDRIGGNEIKMAADWGTTRRQGTQGLSGPELHLRRGEHERFLPAP